MRYPFHPKFIIADKESAARAKSRGREVLRTGRLVWVEYEGVFYVFDENEFKRKGEK